MIYIMAGPSNETGPMSTEAICAVAKVQNVPVLVDAAAEVLTVNPNVHLQRGATLVCYSGGKAIRGPQSAGLLLGRKDLCQAAWVHSAPHHGYARAIKIGREEVVGMVVAVESWVKRDHAAVFKDWIARLTLIADRVSKIPGVTATVRPDRRAETTKRPISPSAGTRKSSASRARRSRGFSIRPNHVSTSPEARWWRREGEHEAVRRRTRRETRACRSIRTRCRRATTRSSRIVCFRFFRLRTHCRWPIRWPRRLRTCRGPGKWRFNFSRARRRTDFNCCKTAIG